MREILSFSFNWKKNEAEVHRMLVKVYDESAPSEELETLLNDYSCQTQNEFAKTLQVTQQAISKRLKAAGYIQKSKGNGFRTN